MEEFESSHRLRLTLRQWAGVLVFGVVLVLAMPRIWRAVEPLETGKTYRVPYELSNDYWLYQRWAERAVETRDTLLIGDSVVWGQYVRPAETLSHYLNSLEGRNRYANLGVDGSHPAALAGLIEHHGAAAFDRRVILHCNPLWMSSPKHDLREKEEFKFNHEKLVPQFSPAIPCYRKETSERLGYVVERNVPFNGWSTHLQTTYFGSVSIPKWTLDHPYESPLKAVTMKLPAPGDELRHEPISWSARGITRQNMPWVDLAGSLQWKSFQRTVDILEKRGNSVFVVVGPFNEHLLTDPSRVKYSELKRGIEDWLKERKIPYFVPEALPSEQYGDASHPLSAGYALLAKQLVATGLLAAK